MIKSVEATLPVALHFDPDSNNVNKLYCIRNISDRLYYIAYTPIVLIFFNTLRIVG